MIAKQPLSAFIFLLRRNEWVRIVGTLWAAKGNYFGAVTADRECPLLMPWTALYQPASL
jgi:hypothetical protein